VPDTRPFLMPCSVVIAGVSHAGTYVVQGERMTVSYLEHSLEVELGEASPGKRAADVLAALVRRSSRPK
jgi:hypothetical protein